MFLGEEILVNHFQKMTIKFRQKKIERSKKYLIN
jgi:hypothetical protein